MAEQYIDEALLQEIRERLWLISKTKKITLEDVEDRTGFSYSQVYRIIRGTKNISVSGLVAVCKALEVQPKDLFDFEVTIPKYHPVRKLNKG